MQHFSEEDRAAALDLLERLGNDRAGTNGNGDSPEQEACNAEALRDRLTAIRRQHNLPADFIDRFRLATGSRLAMFAALLFYPPWAYRDDSSGFPSPTLADLATTTQNSEQVEHLVVEASCHFPLPPPIGTLSFPLKDSLQSLVLDDVLLPTSRQRPSSSNWAS